MTQISEHDLLKGIVGHLSGHEFRTPMTGILGLARLLNDASNEIPVQDKAEFTGNIVACAERLVYFSERISLLNILYEEKECKQNNSFQLFEKNITDVLLEMALKYNISNLIKVSTSVSFCKISGNKKLFLLGLKELFDNACKFSRNNSCICLAIIEKEGNLILSITNKSDVTNFEDFKNYKVFTQFNRNKYEQQGLGIGIEIARLCVENSKGNLQFEGLNLESGCEISFIVKVPIG